MSLLQPILSLCKRYMQANSIQANRKSPPFNSLLTEVCLGRDIALPPEQRARIRQYNAVIQRLLTVLTLGSRQHRPLCECIDIVLNAINVPLEVIEDDPADSNIEQTGHNARESARI